MKLHGTLALWLGILLAPAAHAQGKVIVVDDDPGPGVDFQSIVLAVEAAQEGDTILIKHSVIWEPAVDINAKSLTLVAEQGAQVLIVNRVMVRNLGPGQRVVLRGLHVEGYAGGPPAILVNNCLGSVLLEDMEGTLKLGSLPFTNPVDVMFVKDSAAVALVATSLQGFGGLVAPPGAALRCVDSNVALYDCQITGNPGKEPKACGFDPSFSPGGHAVHCSGGFLFCSGSTLLGGKGGDGTCCSSTCKDGAAGGSGVVLEPGATEPQAVFLDTLSAGGPGGAGGFCPLGSLCADGQGGLGFEVVAGGATVLPGESVSVTASSPVREGATLTLDVHGPAGVAVFLGISLEPTFKFFEALSGIVLVDGHSRIIALGPLGSGDLHVALPIPFMDPSLEALTFQTQVAYLSAIGAIVLGSSSTVTLLDEAF